MNWRGWFLIALVLLVIIGVMAWGGWFTRG